MNGVPTGAAEGADPESLPPAEIIDGETPDADLQAEKVHGDETEGDQA